MMKSGVLAVPFIIAYWAWVLYVVLVQMLRFFFVRSNYSQSFVAHYLLLAFSVVLMFEDIDAFETNALLFGVFLGVVVVVDKAATRSVAVVGVTR
jgi:hypothetical protein